MDATPRTPAVADVEQQAVRRGSGQPLLLSNDKDNNNKIAVTTSGKTSCDWNYIYGEVV